MNNLKTYFVLLFTAFFIQNASSQAFPDQTQVHRSNWQSFTSFQGDAWQSFKVGEVVLFKQVDLYLSSSSQISTVLKIFSGTGTNGPLLHQQNITIPSTSGWVNFTLSKSIRLEKNTAYTFLIQRPTSGQSFSFGYFSNNNYDGTQEDAYPHGNFKGYSSKDLCFKIYVNNWTNLHTQTGPSLQTGYTWIYTGQPRKIGVKTITGTTNSPAMSGEIGLNATVNQAEIIGVESKHPNVSVQLNPNGSQPPSVSFNLTGDVPANTVLLDIEVDGKSQGTYYFQDLDNNYTSSSAIGPDLTRFITKYHSFKVKNWFQSGSSSTFKTNNSSDKALIFPNPIAKGETMNLSFNAAKEEIVLFTVTDLLGRKIFNANIPADGTGKQIYTFELPSNLKRGIYLYSFYDSDNNVQAGEILVK